MNTDHAKFMTLAIEEARKGLRAGERPFGAVVVQGEEIVARKYSVVESAGDPTSHAENLAVRAATGHLKISSLKGCTLYASCEPCPITCREGQQRPSLWPIVHPQNLLCFLLPRLHG